MDIIVRVNRVRVMVDIVWGVVGEEDVEVLPAIGEGVDLPAPGEDGNVAHQVVD